MPQINKSIPLSTASNNLGLMGILRFPQQLSSAPILPRLLLPPPSTLGHANSLPRCTVTVGGVGMHETTVTRNTVQVFTQGNCLLLVTQIHCDCASLSE